MEIPGTLWIPDLGPGSGTRFHHPGRLPLDSRAGVAQGRNPDHRPLRKSSELLPRGRVAAASGSRHRLATPVPPTPHGTPGRQPSGVRLVRERPGRPGAWARPAASGPPSLRLALGPQSQNLRCRGDAIGTDSIQRRWSGLIPARVGVEDPSANPRGRSPRLRTPYLYAPWAARSVAATDQEARGGTNRRGECGRASTAAERRSRADS